MQVKRDTLAAAMAVGADDATHFYDIDRIVLNDKRAFATNGKVAIMVSEEPILDDDDDEEDVLLRAEDAKGVVKAAGRRKSAVVTVDHHGYARVNGESVSAATTQKRRDVPRYPTAKQVESTKPTADVVHRVTLGVDVLSRLVTASKRVGVEYLSFAFRDGFHQPFGFNGRNDDEDSWNYGARLEGYGMPVDMG